MNAATLWVTVLLGLHLLGGCRSASSSAPPDMGLPGIFVDRAQEGGIRFNVSLRSEHSPLRIKESVGHGAGMIDYDSDGLLDLIFLGKDSVRVYHNEGDWKFTDFTESLGLRQPGDWQGLAVGDYANDGYPDLYLCGYDCSALYHNENGRSFREVTRDAGLHVAPPDKDHNPEWRTTAGFFDANQDGMLDLYVGRYAKFGAKTVQLCRTPTGVHSCAPEMYKGQKGSLYINSGNGIFRDESAARGIAAQSTHTLGVAIADFDSDGRIDFALANDGTPGNLFHNQGSGKFKDIGTQSGAAYDMNGKTHAGMGIDWGDYDGDARQDLFVTTYEDETKNLYRNIDVDTFMDHSQQLGILEKTYRWISWGARFLDYDRDGQLDLFIVNGHVMDNAHILGKGRVYDQPLQLFRNEGRRFKEVSSEAGPSFGRKMVGRALCTGDLNNDGLVDAVVSNMEGRPLVLENSSNPAGNWVGFYLKGSRSPRDGTGAEVIVSAGEKRWVKTCSTTGSYLSAHDPRVYFGIGGAQEVNVTIRWPSGKQDIHKNVRAGRYLIAREGANDLSETAYSEGASKRMVSAR